MPDGGCIVDIESRFGNLHKLNTTRGEEGCGNGGGGAHGERRHMSGRFDFQNLCKGAEKGKRKRKNKEEK